MSRPEISVIMPSFNPGGMILSALQPILSQDSVDVELIICDDCSTDGSFEAIRQISDPRLRLLRNPSNFGPGPSRDMAIERARAPWVALVDADDQCHPDRLRVLLDTAVKYEADVVFDDTMLCHDTRSGLVPWKALHGTEAFGAKGLISRLAQTESYIVSERLLIHPMIRTDFLRKHDIQHSSRRFAEDAEFYLRLGLLGARFCYVPEPLYHYRITPGSLTAHARDPSLMRQCIEECAQWDGWWPSAQSAFAKKIGALRRHEALYDLFRLFTQRDLGGVFRLLRTEPHLLGTAPRKALTQLRYHSHRLLHGGRRR